MKINELKIGDRIKFHNHYGYIEISDIINLDKHCVYCAGGYPVNCLSIISKFVNGKEILINFKSISKISEQNKEFQDLINTMTEKLLEFGGCNAHSRQIEKAFWAGFVEGYKINDK